MSQDGEPARADAPARDELEKPKPRRLGKGLGALLGESRREEPLARDAESGTGAGDRSGGDGASDAPSAPSRTNGLMALAVAAIEPHPDQPRRYFAEDALDELAASIAQRGVIQPVIVRPLAGGRYQLVAGERRWRAAQRARLHTIPALVRDLEEREVMALALIENVQREDLNPVEEARAYQRLADGEGMTQAEIGRLVDKSRSHIANFQRLLSLPEPVLSHVEQARLSMGHARALVGHDDAVALAELAIARNLSVREVEALARGPAPANGSRPRRTRTARPGAENADLLAVQGNLEDMLGLTVRIAGEGEGGKGTVTIRYQTLDQLDLICQRLTGGQI